MDGPAGRAGVSAVPGPPPRYPTHWATSDRHRKSPLLTFWLLPTHPAGQGVFAMAAPHPKAAPRRSLAGLWGGPSHSLDFTAHPLNCPGGAQKRALTPISPPPHYL